MSFTVPELEAEIKRMAISLDAQIQENTADKAAHAQAVADMESEHREVVRQMIAKDKEATKSLTERHKKEVESLTAQHATALARAIAEPPEVRAHREKRAKLAADHAALAAAADQELHAAMTTGEGAGTVTADIK